MLPTQASATHRNIRILGWLNFCNDFRVYGAIAVLYFTQITGSFALGLGVFSIATIASSLFELPTGIFSDLVGRRMTIVYGQTASAVAITCYAIGGSFEVLAIGAVLEWLASSLFSGNNSALLYESLKENGIEERYAEFEGKTGAMFQVGLSLGALIGSFALGWTSFAFLFWLSVIPQVIGVILALFLVEPRRAPSGETNIFVHLRTALQRFHENSQLRILSLTAIFDWAIGQTMHQFSPAFLATLWPVWAVSAARVFDHAFAAVGFRFAGRLVKKFWEFRVLVANSVFGYTLGLVAIGYPTVLSPALQSIASLGFGPWLVAKNSLLQKEFSDSQRATMGSLNALAGSFCFAVIAFSAGWFADRVGPRYAMLSLQILYLGVFWLYWRLLCHRTTAVQ